jgi:hypothetical protein
MKITPNMSKQRRVLYVVLGLAMVATPLVAPVSSLGAVVLPVTGILAVISGAVGF